MAERSASESETWLNAEQRGKAEAVYQALGRAFVWRRTPQGEDYWREVCTNLRKLAAAPPSPPPTKAERLAEAMTERVLNDRAYLESRAQTERLYNLWIASVDKVKAIEAEP